MGGISCYFQFDSSQNKAVLDDENLNKSLKYISHRGPGATSTYFSACGRTGLGFAQLSIIDLDNGQQPLSNQQDDIHVVLDGELYASKQIQNELQAKGCQLKTNSDSEIARCLYQEYGLSFLDHLRGEFSVCIWDAKKTRFILARDRFGVKPLYYTIVKGTLLVASEIKAFLSLGWEPEWDIDSLMSNGVLFDCRTAFKGVNKLPPAHYMVATSTASIQIRPYWCQKYANKYVQDTHNIESMIQGVRQRLVEAVKQRLKTDMAIGIYLDDEEDNISSCCVAGIVNQIRKESNSSQHIKAFSLAIVDDTTTTASLNDNRAVIAKTTAELCDADLEILQITEQELLDNFEESIWHTEQPHLDLKHVGKFMLSKLVRDQGFKVVLTGQGADEHFAGHPHFLRDYLKETDITLPDSFDTLSDQDRNALLQEIDMNTAGKNQAQSMLGNATAPVFLEINFALTPSFYSKAAIKKHGYPNRVLTVAEALNGISRNNAKSGKLGIKKAPVNFNFEAAEAQAKQDLERNIKYGQQDEDQEIEKTDKGDASSPSTATATSKPLSSRLAYMDTNNKNKEEEYEKLGFGMSRMNMNDDKTNSISMPSQKSYQQQEEDSRTAREKFGSAKAISSDQYFGRNEYDPAISAAESSRLSQFTSAKAISSDQYFGRESDMDNQTSRSYSNSNDMVSLGDWDNVQDQAVAMARKFVDQAALDLDAVKDLAENATSKVRHYFNA